MTKTRISVTEAARNFADCVNRAHYQNATFVLLRNGEPVARAWHRDLQAARKTLKAPADKWR